MNTDFVNQGKLKTKYDYFVLIVRTSLFQIRALIRSEAGMTLPEYGFLLIAAIVVGGPALVHLAEGVSPNEGVFPNGETTVTADEVWHACTESNDYNACLLAKAEFSKQYVLISPTCVVRFEC